MRKTTPCAPCDKFPASRIPSMTPLLVAECALSDARVLVLGAGGGLELKALAEAHSGWTFDGVDPSPDMLALAE